MSVREGYRDGDTKKNELKNMIHVLPNIGKYTCVRHRYKVSLRSLYPSPALPHFVLVFSIDDFLLLTICLTASIKSAKQQKNVNENYNDKIHMLHLAHSLKWCSGVME